MPHVGSTLFLFFRIHFFHTRIGGIVTVCAQIMAENIIEDFDDGEWGEESIATSGSAEPRKTTDTKTVSSVLNDELISHCRGGPGQLNARSRALVAGIRHTSTFST